MSRLEELIELRERGDGYRAIRDGVERDEMNPTLRECSGDRLIALRISRGLQMSRRVGQFGMSPSCAVTWHTPRTLGRERRKFDMV